MKNMEQHLHEEIEQSNRTGIISIVVMVLLMLLISVALNIQNT